MEAELSEHGQLIECPKCRHQFPITEAIAKQLEAKIRSEFSEEASQKEIEFLEKEKALAVKEENLKKEERAIDERITQGIMKEKEKLEKEATTKAKEEASLERSDLMKQVEEKENKVLELQKKELELRKSNRELENKQRELELENARKLDAERKQIKDDAIKHYQEEFRLKESEWENQQKGLKEEIDRLQRKADQGSTQLQGEVQELELEERLKIKFPADFIEPVQKGQRGGDILQHVHDHMGATCGKILWESKRTKNWSEGWIEKLKTDQRAAKADIAVIVTTAMPKDFTNSFGEYKGIWITNLNLADGLATALRLGLMEVAKAKLASVGKVHKMEVLYNYLTSREFVNRVESIIEAFDSMHADLYKEKKAMTSYWAKREKQLDRILESSTGMVGDIQGIIGASLPEIKGIELKELPAGQNVEQDS